MHQFFEEKGVEFLPLSAETIKAYVDTGEPMDKAGSYGIQAGAAAFVKQVHGCYYNVVGFPALRFAQETTALFSPPEKKVEEKQD